MEWKDHLKAMEQMRDSTRPSYCKAPSSSSRQPASGRRKEQMRSPNNDPYNSRSPAYATGGHISTSYSRGEERALPQTRRRQMQQLAAQGRGGDTELAAIGPRTARMLDELIHGGRRQRNPRTGLREYWPCNEHMNSDPNCHECQVGPILDDNYTESMNEKANALIKDAKDQRQLLGPVPDDNYTESMKKKADARIKYAKHHRNNALIQQPSAQQYIQDPEVTNIYNSLPSFERKLIKDRWSKEEDKTNKEVQESYQNIVNKMNEGFEPVTKEKSAKLKGFYHYPFLQKGNSCASHSAFRAHKYVQKNQDKINNKSDFGAIPQNNLVKLEPSQSDYLNRYLNNLQNKNVNDYNHNEQLHNNDDEKKYFNEFTDFMKSTDPHIINGEAEGIEGPPMNAANHLELRGYPVSRFEEKYPEIYTEFNHKEKIKKQLDKASNALKNNWPVILRTHEDFGNGNAGPHSTILHSIKPLDKSRNADRIMGRQALSRNDALPQDIRMELSKRVNYNKAKLNNKYTHKLKISDSNYHVPRKSYLNINGDNPNSLDAFNEDTGELRNDIKSEIEYIEHMGKNFK